MAQKCALITGITGMVGSHLADYLLEHTDWDVVGMCRWRSSLDNIDHHLQRANKNERLSLLYGDLRDYHSIHDVVATSRPDYVFHLAAQSYPKTSFVSPNDTFETNIQGTANVMEALRKNNLKDAIVHVCSSSEVFGRVPKEKLPINEDCTFHPASPYAISKVGTDLVGRFYAEAYGLVVMTTRMFTHTGPRRGDVFAESSFAKQIAMIEAVLIPPSVKTGNLDSLRTFADVRDAVRAYYMLVTVKPTSGAYYNIGGTYTCKIGEMLHKLLSLSTRKDIEVIVDPERLRPIDADLQVPNMSKFKQHTGWEPVIPFEKTMHDLLDYWRSRVKSGQNFFGALIMSFLSKYVDDAFFFPKATVPHNDFSPRHAYIIALMELYAQNHKSVQVLEAGSWCGYSAVLWAQAIKEFYDGHGNLTCVDAWTPYFNDHDKSRHLVCQMSDLASDNGAAHQVFLHNMEVANKKLGITINSIRGKTEDILPLLQENTFDIVYLDAAHSYLPVSRDLPLCARLVREGGYICGDDLEIQFHELSPESIALAKEHSEIDSCIEDPIKKRSFHPGVMLAVHEFFGQVSTGAGFWAMQKQNGKFQRVNLALERIIKPIHLNPTDYYKEFDVLMNAFKTGKYAWSK